MNKQQAQATNIPTSPLGIEALRADINTLLVSHCNAQLVRAEAISGSYAQLWRVIGEQFDAGGKRIRPYLCMLLYEAYGGREYQAVLPVAASLELVHTAMLMHDDIIDRDYVRHGKANVAGAYQQLYKATPYRSDEASHFASAAALLAGDLMLSDAYQLMQTSAVDSDTKAKLSSLIGDALYFVIAGELLDSEAVLFLPEQADSLQIAKLKTAIYSFTTPMLAAAFLTGVPETEIKLLRAFAGKLGLAYQLADDLLGVFGDSAKTGKSSISDIREGKRSYLLQQTFKRADKTQQKTLNMVIGNSGCDEIMAESVRAIMVASGAKAETERLMQAYADAANAKLQLLNIPEPHKQQLSKLMHTAIWRSA